MLHNAGGDVAELSEKRIKKVKALAVSSPRAVAEGMAPADGRAQRLSPELRNL